MNSPAGCSVQWDNDGGTGNPGWETNSLDMDDFGQAHDTYLAHDVALSLYLSCPLSSYYYSSPMMRYCATCWVVVVVAVGVHGP